MIDRDIHLAKALLVESNALLRSVAADQLRSLGVSQVTQVSRPRDARLAIEREPFDIVLCSRDFEGSNETGQDLLDELRRENLIPFSTVFIMITSQAAYHEVVEAAEAQLDGILVRPYNATLLGERLMESRRRKRELGDILRALDAGQLESALARALKRFQEQKPFATYCGRLVAELFLRLQRPHDAQLMFERLAQPRRPQWALLGAARAMLAAGDAVQARRALEAILSEDPKCADAHDVLGRICVDQCDFDRALQHYREAAAITPGCLLRTQHAAALAFYQGHAGESLKTLERALGMGVQSKLFDALTLLLMAVLRLDAGDRPGVESMREQLRRYRERFPDSVRLQRMGGAADVLVALAQGQGEAALQALRPLSAQVRDDDFDLEAANTVLMLWSRLPEANRPSAEYQALVEDLAMRFCVSKAIGEVLLAAGRRNELVVAIVRRCQARIAQVAEQAMDLALKGEVEQAVRQLLDAGERARNAKLLELSVQVARRQGAQLAVAAACIERAQQVLATSCSAVNHIAGIQRAGRSPGGLQIRGRAAAESSLVAFA